MVRYARLSIIINGSIGRHKKMGKPTYAALGAHIATAGLDVFKESFEHPTDKGLKYQRCLGCYPWECDRFDPSSL
jgi:hypothetical protein